MIEAQSKPNAAQWCREGYHSLVCFRRNLKDGAVIEENVTSLHTGASTTSTIAPSPKKRKKTFASWPRMLLRIVYILAAYPFLFEPSSIENAVGKGILFFLGFLIIESIAGSVEKLVSRP